VSYPVNNQTPAQPPRPRHAALAKGGKHVANKGGKSKFPVAAGIVALTLMGVVAIVMFALLIRFGAVPPVWLIAAGAAVAILLVLLAAGCSAKKTVARIICFAVCILFSVIFLIGSIFIGKAISTLNNIHDDDTTISYNVSVVVMADDPAQTITDTVGYTFGILELIDRPNTDKTLDFLYDDIGSVSTAEYSNISTLAEGLISGETGAILLNEGYRDLLAESYSSFNTDTRVLHTYSVEEEKKDSIFGSETEDGDPISTPGSITETNEYDSFIVYLTGIDTYGSEMTASRSDVNILAVVNPATKQVLLVTTPRDAYVELPTQYYNMDKLTHAALYGGVEASIATLSNLYDISIDHYVRLNFTGFSTIVDALGGIEVYSEVEFWQTDDNGNDHYYEQGWNYLDGEAALCFVRSRYAFVDGDFQRGKNQMAAIQAILDKVMSPSILTSYIPLMNSIEGSFSTNFTDDEIADLVQMQLDDGASWNISSYEVAGWADAAWCYSLGEEASIVYLDSESVAEVQDMIRAVYNGETLN